MRVILFYVLYCILNEVISFYLQAIRSPDIIVLFAFFSLIEYSFFCYFFYSIVTGKIIKKVVPLIWLGFLSFASIDFFYINEMKSFDSFGVGIESIIILLLCVYYFYLQTKSANDFSIYSTFNFWIMITFLIYFSGTFFLYILTENMVYNTTFQKQYLIINSSFSILKNILLSIAMCMKAGKSKVKEPSIPELDDDFFFQRKD